MLYMVSVLPLVALSYSLHDIDVQQQISRGSSSSSSSSMSVGAVTESGITTTTAPVSVEQRAISWLLTQRDPRDFGFRNDTALVLITVQVARGLGLSTVALLDPIDVALSGKQLEVETVVALWRHATSAPSPHRLALACLALTALCRDPRQFHGHDLIGTLLHNHEDHQPHQPLLLLQLQLLQRKDNTTSGDGANVQQQQQHDQHLGDLDFGYATLAACAARAHVRKREVRRLLDIANSPQRHNIDTLAVTIMTLRCIIVHDHRHRNWLHSIRKPSVSLARQQLHDGSFGNVYNTVLAMQALSAPTNSYWRAAAARRWLELHQDPDGAFTDPGLTAMTALALMNRGLDTVRTLVDSAAVCLHTPSPSSSSSAAADVVVPLTHAAAADEHEQIAADADGADNSSQAAAGGNTLDLIDSGGQSNQQQQQQYMFLPSGKSGGSGDRDNNNNNNNVSVTYTLWIGGSSSNMSTDQVVASVRVDCGVRNATFYTVMVMAAELDPVHFAFDASEWPNGHYVHTIAGHREEPMGYHYWLLYRLDERPDPAHPPGSHQVAPVGVDDLLVEDGDHFLFWYKKL